MNARMNGIALGCLALGLLSGCTSHSTKPTHVALASMDSLTLHADSYDPLLLASGDSLGMELHVWHVVSTDPDPEWMLAVGD
ncbi:MAG: hypothetical protein VX727_08665 [Planctomycetota bacterium]|nr:hypothetical protein [Planctomycetota bacterium]